MPRTAGERPCPPLDLRTYQRHWKAMGDAALAEGGVCEPDPRVSLFILRYLHVWSPWQSCWGTCSPPINSFGIFKLSHI